MQVNKGDEGACPDSSIGRVRPVARLRCRAVKMGLRPRGNVTARDHVVTAREGTDLRGYVTALAVRQPAQCQQWESNLPDSRCQHSRSTGARLRQPARCQYSRLNVASTLPPSDHSRSTGIGQVGTLASSRLPRATEKGRGVSPALAQNVLASRRALITLG